MKSSVRYWKYFQTIGCFAARDAPLVQPLGVLDDVLVVFEQQLGGQLRQVEELRRERVMEMMDVVLVQPFQLLVAQMLGQLLEPLHVEQRKQPLVQDQLVGKRHLRPVVGAALRRDGSACCFAGVHAPSQTLRIEHQPVEVLLDQPDLPGVIGRFQVLQIVVAVDVDEVELVVLG